VERLHIKLASLSGQLVAWTVLRAHRFRSRSQEGVGGKAEDGFTVQDFGELFFTMCVRSAVRPLSHGAVPLLETQRLHATVACAMIRLQLSQLQVPLE
jgi:hypothetical protein